MTDLAEIDTEAVTEAVEVLRDHEFRIREVYNVERNYRGVSFDLQVEKSTRQASLGGDA